MDEYLKLTGFAMNSETGIKDKASPVDVGIQPDLCGEALIRLGFKGPPLRDPERFVLMSFVWGARAQVSELRENQVDPLGAWNPNAVSDPALFRSPRLSQG